eukprot:363328-Chlamydomonas_euryale.AAC.2
MALNAVIARKHTSWMMRNGERCLFDINKLLPNAAMLLMPHVPTVMTYKHDGAPGELDTTHHDVRCLSGRGDSNIAATRPKGTVPARKLEFFFCAAKYRGAFAPLALSSNAVRRQPRGFTVD